MSWKELLSGVCLEKERLLQRAEESLIGRRIFDGSEIVLGAGPDDELRFSTRTDCGGEPDKVSAVIKGSPGAILLRENQQSIVAIHIIGGIGPEFPSFEVYEFLARDDIQNLIRYFHRKAQVLESAYHRL